MISPSGYPAQIGGILDHKNESVMFARPGENVQIKLIHIDDEDMIKKGDVITGREHFVRTSKESDNRKCGDKRSTQVREVLYYLSCAYHN